MPATPYAQVQASINAGAATSGGITVPSAATVQLSPVSTVGWTTAPLWEIYDYPVGWATPAGWTLQASGIITSTAITPPSFTLPAASTLWGKWAIRLTSNNNNDPNNLYQVDEGTILSMLSATKLLRSIAYREGAQFGGAQRQWVGELQACLRSIEAASGSYTPPTGSGFPHITAGAQDAAAIHGTAGQIPVGNAGGTDVAFVSVSGDATLGSTGVVAVGQLSGFTSVVTIPNGVTLKQLDATGFFATTGTIRTSPSFSIVGRNSTNASDVTLIQWDGANNINIGASTGVGTLSLQGNSFTFYSSGAAYLDCSSVSMRGAAHGATQFSVDGTNCNVGLPQIGAGVAWGSNDAIGTQAMADANQTPAAAVYQCKGIKTTGAITANRNLQLPTATDAQGYAKWINNTCSGAFSVQVQCAAGTTVLVANGKSAWMWIDSRGVTRMTADV